MSKNNKNGSDNEIREGVSFDGPLDLCFDTTNVIDATALFEEKAYWDWVDSNAQQEFDIALHIEFEEGYEDWSDEDIDFLLEQVFLTEEEDDDY